ncbi:ATP-binding protein [Leptospira wolffii]|uniref:YifB family Mg chelatase-like AAA ATPase n=1 Tax=Leptospira wolffii TaxID=409998 RepID=UPI00108386C2|nr:YifB family Mg chelatase-like AAA ATPase [Leptospira wolffii]TGK56699.1 ATP-binding protein [Leptospira wolffii]TGK71719.1 ATP-binding protein [Leptospira wolffii]TGK75424.1 ATP-binding protein [Leptospira wolffii]TGL33086.1 ATP-binding protein [Leptospira wolffii]
MEVLKLVRLQGASLEGIRAFPVSVEINMKRGIPRFAITGLATTAIKESADRIRIAVENSGFDYSLLNILVHLAPAGRKKEGTYLDLPIAAGILSLTGQLPYPERLEKFLLLGELGLDGSLKPLRGILPILMSVGNSEYSQVVVPYENREEASVLGQFSVFPISHLRDLVPLLKGEISPEPKGRIRMKPEVYPWKAEFFKSQLPAVRAVQIASAGFHHCLLSGSPGTGKTMLSKLAYSFLPPIGESEGVELLALRSFGELLCDTEVERPFRSPHHTASDISLVGGSSNLKMGEVSLASHGILFLDELSEFQSRTLQALREPMEEGKITVSRITGSVTHPAPFLLMAATNPCPCGYFESGFRPCTCSPSTVKKYQAPFTGPFWDRVEIFCQLRVSGDPDQRKVPVDLKKIRDSVTKAAEIQRERLWRRTGKLYNGRLRGDEVEACIPLSKELSDFLNESASKLRFSIRKSSQWRKVARTIADLEGSGEILERHLEEALVFLNSGWSPENRAVA